MTAELVAVQPEANFAVITIYLIRRRKLSFGLYLPHSSASNGCYRSLNIIFPRLHTALSRMVSVLFSLVKSYQSCCAIWRDDLMGPV